MRLMEELLVPPCFCAILPAARTKSRRNRSCACSEQKCRYPALLLVDCWQLTTGVAAHSSTSNNSLLMAVQLTRVEQARRSANSMGKPEVNRTCLISSPRRAPPRLPKSSRHGHPNRQTLFSSSTGSLRLWLCTASMHHGFVI